MKAFAPIAALALFLVSVIASPLPEVITIGSWTGAKKVSIPNKRAAEPEGYDLSAWSGTTHASIQEREYDLGAWKGVLKASIEGRETEEA